MSRRRNTGGSSSPHVPQETDPEDDRKRDNYEKILRKKIVSTPSFDFSDLDDMGIFDDFFRLTSRIGIKTEFWCISANFQACPALTREFLSSLVILTRKGVAKGIKFTLKGEEYKMRLDTLREWFGFDEPDTQHLGYLPEDQTGQDDPSIRSQRRRDFWPLLSGVPLPGVAHPDLTVKGIVHPVLRCICRSLGSSLFARGESSYRPMNEELELISTMLRPDDQFQRPDLMLEMARFWTTIPHSGKPTGVIAMGSYVSFIASKLDLSLQRFTMCPAARPVDRDQFVRWQWITVSQTYPRVTSWLTSQHGTYIMPIPVPPLSYTDRRTWVLPPPTSLRYQGGPVSPHASPSQQQDVDMTYQAPPESTSPRYHTRQRTRYTAPAAPSSSAGPQPSSHAPQPVPYHIPEWQWNIVFQNSTDTYNTVERIQREQTQQSQQIRALQEAQARDRASMESMREDLFFCFRELQFEADDVPYDDYDPYAGFATSDFEDDDGDGGDRVAPAGDDEH